ncbi:MAG: hypothetical protein QHC90_06230 [Shinella sp.]|nr:hypothetical protein [Shinella sp.]
MTSPGGAKVVQRLHLQSVEKHPGGALHLIPASGFTVATRNICGFMAGENFTTDRFHARRAAKNDCGVETEQ